MSQLGCICGERMTKTSCPSPCSLDIFYKEEIDRAIYEDPSITLHSFLSGWDERNDCAKKYMDRPEPVDYWCCPACKRVYEVQYIPGGRWLRIYKKANDPVAESFEGWTRIYVLPDVETDAATEKDWEIHLSDYLLQHDSIRYYLSPDEKIRIESRIRKEPYQKKRYDSLKETEYAEIRFSSAYSFFQCGNPIYGSNLMIIKKLPFFSL